jgi:Ca2+-binding RTX toxin-like protein
MAKLVAAKATDSGDYVALDILKNPSAFFSNITSTEFTVQLGNLRIVVTGRNLAVDEAASDPITGVIESITVLSRPIITVPFSEWYKLAGFEVDAATFVDAIGPGQYHAAVFNHIIFGDDRLFGSISDDGLSGWSGNDIIRTGGGDDNADGGGGNDLVYGGDGGDDLYGSIGNDRIFGGKGDDELDGSGDRDLLRGGRGNDELDGGGDRDRLFGDAGNDNLKGSEGKDKLDGGTGFDTADYDGFSNEIKVTLKGSEWVTVFSDGVADDKVRNVENVNGGGSADRLTGDARSNIFRGDYGNDILKGKGGVDWLDGGSELDTLTGGKGADNFLFEYAYSGDEDTITDFKPGEDKIVLFGSQFDVVGDGPLDPDYFALNAADDADDFIIYKPGTGELFFDADGSLGGEGPRLIATLLNKPALTAADISYLSDPPFMT